MGWGSGVQCPAAAANSRDKVVVKGGWAVVVADKNCSRRKTNLRGYVN